MNQVDFENKETTHISPTFTYSINLSNLTCPEKSCLKTHKFENLRTKSCNTNIICNQLSGNICGSYGIQYSTSNSNQIHSICYEGNLK